ncbi:NADH dehydrogenase Fe-S protein subunit 4 ndufs4 [Rhizophlyctis rosea]|uniref:NADH dehydrogenase Fe-S protein subunit 4 ndufs4 n=1 Tax=Rhizophlyctis rosea TaxID=64517 RepID=A0AAD5X0W8_9FUNG|nr:NADH dehydrogenase Fe-S protein subunit 4 ndufs4 [Rhizophlyctis rosea]
MSSLRPLTRAAAPRTPFVRLVTPQISGTTPYYSAEYLGALTADKIAEEHHKKGDLPLPANGERKIFPADFASGVPPEIFRPSVRIYKPAKTAMQSRTKGMNDLRLDFNTQARWENPLMGWSSSDRSSISRTRSINLQREFSTTVSTAKKLPMHNDHLKHVEVPINAVTRKGLPPLPQGRKLPALAPPMAPPPQAENGEANREFIFVDNNVIGSFVEGEYSLLNAYLLHPDRKIYYTRLVSNGYRDWLKPDSPDPPDPPFEFCYVYGGDTTINRAAEYIKIRAKLPPKDFDKIAPDIKMISEACITVPEGRDQQLIQYFPLQTFDRHTRI